MTDWLIWAALLAAQNATHTASSRAKNSKSLRYSALAGVLSNGTWFASLYITVGKMHEAETPFAIAATGLFYVAMTVGGTVLAHWYLMRYERKNGL